MLMARLTPSRRITIYDNSDLLIRFTISSYRRECWLHHPKFETGGTAVPRHQTHSIRIHGASICRNIPRPSINRTENRQIRLRPHSMPSGDVDCGRWFVQNRRTRYRPTQTIRVPTAHVRQPQISVTRPAGYFDHTRTIQNGYIPQIRPSKNHKHHSHRSTPPIHRTAIAHSPTYQLRPTFRKRERRTSRSHVVLESSDALHHRSRNRFICQSRHQLPRWRRNITQKRRRRRSSDPGNGSMGRPLVQTIYRHTDSGVR